MPAALRQFTVDDRRYDFGGPSIHLEPDILVGRMPAKVARWEAVRDHWLAVEVSGVGSRVYDRDYKRDGYLEVGVAEVWLVDIDLEHRGAESFASTTPSENGSSRDEGYGTGAAYLGVMPML